VLAAAGWLMAPSAEPPAELAEEDQDCSNDPELPLLQGSAEQGSPGKGALLLDRLQLDPLPLQVLQHLNHFPAQIVLTLLHAHARSLVQLRTNEVCLIDKPSKEPCHGLREEGEKEFSISGREERGQETQGAGDR